MAYPTVQELFEGMKDVNSFLKFRHINNPVFMWFMKPDFDCPGSNDHYRLPIARQQPPLNPSQLISCLLPCPDVKVLNLFPRTSHPCDRLFHDDIT